MEPGSSETRASVPPAHPIAGHGFAPGTMLAGRYRIVALVGCGGMGEVYRADDLTLGQPVALKFLPSGLEHDPAARERLLAEVRNARTVSHPNVCRVYDVGELEGSGLKAQGSGAEADGSHESKGRAFLTMEYIDGEDLASLLRRIGRLPAPKALDIARQLCAGLAAAHDKGVLHRDLKPANVMIDGRGQARITDFGLAVEATSAGPPGDAAGTLAYMAPERFAGRPATVQSDLYALGLILYETSTGHAPFTASTVGDWQRAHSSSTPAAPSSHVSDIEPAVERVILRCLEKDPARRPASAAQVAAALPGGDPLAAAIAAGETPSPELVAASGEEGTLPRWQAWAWLAACLVTMTVAAAMLIPLRLTEQVQITLSPDALRARARDILLELGHRDRAADSAWWYRPDETYVSRLNRLKPSEAAAELRRATPTPLRFCYRQSPATLVPLSSLFRVSSIDPPPRTGDAYLELDMSGRLLALRVTPPAWGQAQPLSGVNWTALFAAAHLGSPESYAAVAPQWWPGSAPDVREAREGLYSGRKVRVEAAARAGRPIFFALVMPWSTAAPEPGVDPTQGFGFSLLPFSVLFWGSLILLAMLARRNMRLGRSDRVAARRLAVAVVVVWASNLALMRDSVAASFDLTNGPGVLAPALQYGLLAWLAYLGLEPPIRRAFPHLLVTSTRLLGGRWRDPLVGRSVLAGILVGLIVGVPWTTAIHVMLDLPGGGPTLYGLRELSSYPYYVGSTINSVGVSAVWVLTLLTVLVVARLASRRAGVAWVVLAALQAGWNFLALLPAMPETISRAVLFAESAACGMLMVWLLWKHGALALAVLYVASAAVYAPWTLDMSRWYAWQGPIAGAIIMALAVWGFRNALGKQSAFPSGALDG